MVTIYLHNFFLEIITSNILLYLQGNYNITSIISNNKLDTETKKKNQ